MFQLLFQERWLLVAVSKVSCLTGPTLILHVNLQCRKSLTINFVLCLMLPPFMTVPIPVNLLVMVPGYNLYVFLCNSNLGLSFLPLSLFGGSAHIRQFLCNYMVDFADPVKNCQFVTGSTKMCIIRTW